MKQFVFLSIALLFVSCGQRKKELPFLGRPQHSMDTIDGKAVKYTMHHRIADFKFINQDSNWVTNETFSGKVYVADFFFTTCPTICPRMKAQMIRVYEAFKNESHVMILSHTIDPTHDTVAVLKDFAEKLGAASNKWHFVTGDKSDIYEIGQSSYIVTSAEDENAPGGYLHSGHFVLVDKNRHIRGMYDGTNPDQVTLLIEDIKLLIQE